MIRHHTRYECKCDTTRTLFDEIAGVGVVVGDVESAVVVAHDVLPGGVGVPIISMFSEARPNARNRKKKKTNTMQAVGLRGEMRGFFLT